MLLKQLQLLKYALQKWELVLGVQVRIASNNLDLYLIDSDLENYLCQFIFSNKEKFHDRNMGKCLVSIH